MIEIIQDYINELAMRYDISSDFVHHYIYIFLILLVAVLIGVIVRKLIGPLLVGIARRTSLRIDDYLLTDNIIGVISRLIPTLFISLIMPLLYFGKDTRCFMWCSIEASTYI